MEGNKRRLLTKSEILKTMTSRSLEKSLIMAAIFMGACAPMILLVILGFATFGKYNYLADAMCVGLALLTVVLLTVMLTKILPDVIKKHRQIQKGAVSIRTDVLSEMRKCQETYTDRHGHEHTKEYDVFDFASGNSYTMKTGLWTQGEKNRIRDQHSVGESFILVTYQKRDWELQLIYPENQYEYVDDTAKTHRT